MSSATQWNRKIKGWAGWLAMLIVFAIAMDNASGLAVTV